MFAKLSCLHFLTLRDGGRGEAFPISGQSLLLLPGDVLDLKPVFLLIFAPSTPPLSLCFSFKLCACLQVEDSRGLGSSVVGAASAGFGASQTWVHMWTQLPGTWGALDAC